MHLTNTPAQTESLEQAARGIGLYKNVNKTEFMYVKQDGAISILSGKSLKLVDQLTYLSRNTSSTESNVSICIAKAWTATNIWKYDIPDKINWDFFQAVAVSVLLDGCATWMWMKSMEKMLNGNYTRMLHVVLNKSCKQHLIKRQLYNHLPCFSQTIQVRQTKHAGHSWRSKGKLISNIHSCIDS